jgi:probable rRNA maturation factor
MTINIYLNNDNNYKDTPSLEKLKLWITKTLEIAPIKAAPTQQAITITLSNNEQSVALNKTYRNKAGPTNILSFPEQTIPGFEMESLGDLIICVPLIIEEAKQQNKTLEAHWAHLTIHGTLHLLGYDHIVETEAEEMECLEVAILARFNITDPYQ